MTNNSGYGPDGRPRAVVLTFDNLGEAAALARGEWDPRTPLGEDPSVTRALPRLLDALDEHGLTATFFVEAINCELNPAAVREIAARGHELGVHGWRHEPWSELAPDAEPPLLERCSAAFAALGLHPRAFRPPGGAPTPRTAELLRHRGYAWVSPVGDAPSVDGGLATVPFAWELVDAFFLMERFANIRRRHGEPAAPLAPAAVEQRLAGGLAADDGVQTLVLHPFLMLAPDWWEGVRGLLDRLASDASAWVVPGGKFAAWLAAGS